MKLIEQLQNDRYGTEYTERDRYALGWNDCSRYIERLLKQRAVERGLRELAEAPALDLRVKRALTEGNG